MKGRVETVLVTGSSGMIGTALMERLLAAGYVAIGADRRENRWSAEVDERTRRVDLRRTDEMDGLPETVDLVVHLASNARVRELVADPAKARDNFEMTFNVLEYARRMDDPRMILASSREVYRSGADVRDVSDVRIDECRNPYAAGKMGAEALASAYRRCYGLQTATLRFANVYGRYDVSDRVVPRFIARAHRGQDLVVYGRKKSLDLLYLDDCVEGILRTIENFPKAAGETFNIASGTGTSLVELAERVIELVPHRVDVEFRANRVGEAVQSVLDITDANAVLDYTPRQSPLEGLSNTVVWYEDSGILNEIR